MLTQSKTSLQSDLKYAFEFALVILGILIGGGIAFIGLWLWFDLQANPHHSFIAQTSAYLVNALPVAAQSFLGYQAELMGLPLIHETSAFWYMARAGGIVSYLLLWLSTIWGLALSTKVISKLAPAPLAYGLHEFLSLATIVFALIHSLVLLGDQYIDFSIFHLAIPFIAPYQPFWTGLGIIGFYLSAAITGSFYIRKQIGQKTWRKLHTLTLLAYALALAHGVMAGTDSSLGVIKLMYLGTGFSVLFLVYYRLLTLKIN